MSPPVNINVLERLTVRREVDLALVGQESVALPLGLELRGELLGGDLRTRYVANLVLAHVSVVVAH